RGGFAPPGLPSVGLSHGGGWGIRLRSHQLDRGAVVREIVGDQSRGRPIWSPTIPRIEAPKQVDASSGVCPIHHRSPVPHWAIPAARSPLDTIAVATGGPKGAPDGGTQAVVPPLCGGRRWGAPPRSGGGRDRLRSLHQTS